MELHHVGIIVNDIKKALRSLKQVLNAKKNSKIIIDKNWKIKILFIKHKNKILFEIIEPLDSKSPIAGQLKKNINIINHIAYKCKNFEKDKKNIIKNGAIPVTPKKEALAFNNKKIQFFMTKEKLLIELIE